MADNTLQEVFDAARVHLGDPDGDLWTNAVLQKSFSQAWRTYYRKMQSVGDPQVFREAYVVVPKNTNILYPATANLNDIGEPLFLSDRGNLTLKTITAASGTTTVTVTAAAHGFETGDIVTVNGVQGLNGTEGIWGITVTDDDNFTLNGAIGSGTYTSGGVAVKSGEGFQESTLTDRIEDVEAGGADRIRTAAWRDNALRFPLLAEERQIRLEYRASGIPPTSTSAKIGADDAIDFLATYTAALAIGSRGGRERSAELTRMALGPNMTPEVTGGLLWELLNNAVKGLQRTPPEQRRRRPFREPRSITPTIY